MLTPNPRINVTFESATAELLSTLAKQEHKSLSGLAKELVLEALEMRDDLAISILAELRDVSGLKTVKHDEAWK